MGYGLGLGSGLGLGFTLGFTGGHHKEPVSKHILVLPAIRVTVRVKVWGGAYLNTHMHARQGCQACGLLRVGGIRSRIRVGLRLRLVFDIALL